jgi:hypothetical protein
MARRAASAVHKAAGKMQAGQGGRGAPKHCSMRTIKGMANRAVNHPGAIRVKAVHKGGGVPRGMTEHSDAIKRGIVNKVAGRAKKKKPNMQPGDSGMVSY